jgi:hypothetical protein
MDPLNGATYVIVDKKKRRILSSLLMEETNEWLDGLVKRI